MDWGGRGGGWPGGIAHIHVWISWEEQLGSETDRVTQFSRVGKQSLKTSGYKIIWGLWLWEKLPVSQENSLEGPTDS